MRPLILWCLCLSLSPLLAAQLQFEQEQLELTAKPGANELSGTYVFTNTGTTPLTITAVDPSCGCTTTELAKHTYAPGERGELNVQFDTTGLGGLQQKTFEVHYDSGPMILLHVRVLLAEAPTVTPTFLYWDIGAPATEQVATFTFPAGVTEQPVKVDASSPAAKGTLYHHDDGTWVLSVIPTATDAPTNVMFKITTDLGRVMRVFASVRKPVELQSP